MPTTPHGKQRLHAGCWIDRAQQGVWQHRQFVPLPARTFAILAYLVDHANHIVTHAELFAVGWGEPRTVWDLQVHIHRIRQIIEPHPHQPRWLITRRDEGYLLHVEPLSQHA